MSQVQHDWPTLKTEYITGNLSIRRLSEIHDIPFSTVKDRASKDHWKTAKTKHRDQIVEKTSAQIANKTAKKLAKELTIADNLSDIIKTALEDNEQFQRYIVHVKDEEGNASDERIFRKRDMKAIGDAVKALGGIVKIKRTIGSLSETDQKSGGVILLPPTLPEPQPPDTTHEG
ncbi:MAG: hypothetical protein RR053_02235 [Evtepia sp.]